MNHQSIQIGSNRSFGIVFFIFFLLIALWPLLNNHEIRLWSLIISLIFLILGILNSKLLSPLNKLWMRFGLLLGKIVSPIIMGIIYFFVVTPTGLIMKIFRKDLLSLKKNDEKSYWIEKNDEKSNMKNQF
ncbi:SxtJ family membrane protein [Candidatus Pelagibacter sp.]|nr:SxtJ family membrane protein [Candidatus Pelagibacter sp.]|tara:strand:+ start:1299 stop:1688 length:390 start_codon:yes stop_codon:yes gene_type:complete